jgi:hypothetical protein
MSDNKSHVGEPDRSRVAGGEDYEIQYLAKKHGISAEQARELVNRHGNNRDVLDREASKLGKH